MNIILALSLFLIGSTVYAKPMSAIIHSLCITPDQKEVVVDMTSPILLPENPSLGDFQLVVSADNQGGPLIDLFLNSKGGMFSNDRRTLRFDKDSLDEHIKKILTPENMIFVKTLNRTISYIFVKQCE
ncbi:MAG: hypothetical protein JNL11_17035 [Bdellovibrionaceae bacterium]|nr:hypothetical protein [Pseudobdellovibrionaceae bacterium]